MTTTNPPAAARAGSQGLIRRQGLSTVNLDQLTDAQRIAPEDL